eukprot:6292985-Pyramimonas_sp.AAC.1
MLPILRTRAPAVPKTRGNTDPDPNPDHSHNITSFCGFSCANNGNGALNTPDNASPSPVPRLLLAANHPGDV